VLLKRRRRLPLTPSRRPARGRAARPVMASLQRPIAPASIPRSASGRPAA